MTTKRLVKISLFVSILCILSLFSIPIGTVPITLQTFGIFLIGILLGPYDGSLAVLGYLLLGSIGLPVFVGGKGGISVLIGPTGGYLVSFPIVAFILGYLTKIKSEVIRFLVLLLSVFIVYAFGVCYLKYVTGMDFIKSIKIGMVPFIIPDIIKAVAAYFISLELDKRIRF